MAPHLEEENWLNIAERASKEMDSAKLMILVGKLCRALDGEREKGSQLQRHPGNLPRSVCLNNSPRDPYCAP
jgi:hypothetical protein